MKPQVTDIGTGLLQTAPWVPKPTLGTSASNAVNNAVNTPTDASRLGTPAPVVQPKPQQGTALAQLQGLNSASALAVQTNQQQAQQTQAQQAQATPAPAPAPSPLQQTLQDILGIGTQLDGQGARSLEIQQGEDVFGKKARAKELENQILSRSQAYEKQIREAMKNEGGGLRSGVAVDVGELQRRSAQELADLSIAYKVANDDYTGAWEIAKAKIDAEFEPLKQRLETLKTYYTLAQNDMTESEKMQAEQKIAEQEKTLEFERNKQMADYKAGIDRENALYTQQLEQSDPLYKERLATEQAQRANIYDQIRERNAPALSDGTATLNGKPQTQTQAKVHGFADRMSQSNKTIAEIGNNFTSSIAFGNYLPNVLQTGDRQAYEQAKRNFVNAVLRQESGAVISPSEFANAEKQYFPTAGDDEKVVLQKQANRNTAINNLYREANVQRPAIAGDIIEDENGKQYKVGIDGVTLEEI